MNFSPGLKMCITASLSVKQTITHLEIFIVYIYKTNQSKRDTQSIYHSCNNFVNTFCGSRYKAAIFTTPIQQKKKHI